MPHDARDELWQTTFETYYDVYYYELLEEKLVRWWQRVDETTKVSVALTASASALYGWSIWDRPYFSTIWGVLAGLAALLSITHAALAVPGRLNDHGEIKRRFAMLRTDLETSRYRMRINPDFPVPEFTQEFVEFRKRYSDCVQLLKDDILALDWFERKVQATLDERLGEQIIH